MKLILTILALGIVFGRRTSEEEEECLNTCFLGLLLIDFLTDDWKGEEDFEDELEDLD